MGMYTELVLGIEIEPTTEVLDILHYMLGDIEDQPECIKQSNHELFKTSRWAIVLRCDSYYFDGQTDSKLFVDNLYEDEPMYYLNVRSNLKNYDSEIEKFMDWLSPYIKTDGFLGYKRYEEDDDPTLIYLEYDNFGHDKEIVYRHPNF